jgi:hypothetical protein
MTNRAMTQGEPSIVRVTQSHLATTSEISTTVTFARGSMRLRNQVYIRRPSRYLQPVTTLLPSHRKERRETLIAHNPSTNTLAIAPGGVNQLLEETTHPERITVKTSKHDTATIHPVKDR